MIPGIGLFGTGAVAKLLTPLLREKGFHIEAIWGPSLQEAEETSRELNVQFFTNKIDDVLLRKQVDLIFIICAPYLHSEIAVKALGIGKHVVCDNLFGLNQVDALKMVRASQYYPQLISLVNYSLRFLPAFSHMKKAVDEGLIIGPSSEISLIDVRVQMGTLLNDKYDWTCDATMGGALNLLGSHVIDLVTFLLGGRRAQRVHGIVRAYTKTTSKINGIRQISAPDFCTFQMEFDGGPLVTANLHSHAVSCSSFVQEVLLYGRDGQLSVRGGDLFVLKTQRGIIQQQTPQHVSKEEALYVDVQDLHIPIQTDESRLPRPYIKGMCKMVGALREAFAQKDTSWVKEPVQSAATFSDGLYVQAVLDALRKSSELKCWRRVEITSESPISHEQLMRYARMSAH